MRVFLGKPLNSTTLSEAAGNTSALSGPNRMETSICFKWDFAWLLFLFWKSNFSFLSHIIMSFLINIVTLYSKCKGEVTNGILWWDSIIKKNQMLGVHSSLVRIDTSLWLCRGEGEVGFQFGEILCCLWKSREWLSYLIWFRKTA